MHLIDRIGVILNPPRSARWPTWPSARRA